MKKAIANMVLVSVLALGITTPVSASDVSPNSFCGSLPCELLR